MSSSQPMFLLIKRQRQELDTYLNTTSVRVVHHSGCSASLLLRVPRSSLPDGAQKRFRLGTTQGTATSSRAFACVLDGLACTITRACAASTLWRALATALTFRI